MPTTILAESGAEDAALGCLTDFGCQTAYGPVIAPNAPGAERADYGDVVLERRLRDAHAALKPALLADALDDAFRKLTRPEGSSLEARIRGFHRMLVNGVEIEYRNAEVRVVGGQD